MNYEYFLNHTTFEILQDNYIRENPTKTLMSVYKEDVLNQVDAKGFDLVNDSEYKHLQRVYKKFRVHNDTMARNHGIGESDGINIQYKNLKTMQEKKDGHEIREFQSSQLVHIKNYKIFNYVLKGMIGDPKKLSHNDFLKAINELGNIYSEILNADRSSFWKCFQFYQLEKSCQFEYFYVVAKAMKKLDKNLRDSEKKILAPVYLHTVEGRIRNKFILGRIEYIKLFMENKVKSEKLINDLSDLSLLKLYLKADLSNYYSENQIPLSSFNENDEFFNELYGCGK
jgi:hypothetical protein